MQRKEIDRWKPILRAGIYCSPACGGRCTVEDFERATKQGAALADSLGAGWAPNVWENLGWHYSAKHNSRVTQFEVHPSADRSYWASLIIGHKQYQGRGKTGAAAVREAIKSAKEHHDAISAVFTELAKGAGK